MTEISASARKRLIQDGIDPQIIEDFIAVIRSQTIWDDLRARWGNSYDKNIDMVLRALDW